MKNNWIQSLQARPYQTRRKLLWLITLVTVLILIVLWGIIANIGTGEKVEKSESQKSSGFFSYLKNSINDARLGVTSLAEGNNDNNASQPENKNLEMIMTSFATDQAASQLIINFQIKNNKDDLLSFTSPDLSNVTLTDGAEKSHPIKMLNDKQQNFPGRILNASAMAGQMIFPLPKSQTVTVSISDLFYLTSAQNKFTTSLELNLNTEATVKGLFQNQLPRQ